MMYGPKKNDNHSVTEQEMDEISEATVEQRFVHDFGMRHRGLKVVITVLIGSRVLILNQHC